MRVKQQFITFVPKLTVRYSYDKSHAHWDEHHVDILRGLLKLKDHFSLCEKTHLSPPPQPPPSPSPTEGARQQQQPEPKTAAKKN